MFKLAVSKVVVHEGRKMFLSNPPIESVVGNLYSVQTENGILHPAIYVSMFSSFDIHGREVDTVVIVYRKGEIFCQGCLCYIGGQSDGYLVLSGFTAHVNGTKPIEVHSPHILGAHAFEEGDEIIFVCRDK